MFITTKATGKPFSSLPVASNYWLLGPQNLMTYFIITFLMVPSA